MTADTVRYRAACAAGHPDALWTAARVITTVRPSATLTREESTVTVTCDACGDGR